MLGAAHGFCIAGSQQVEGKSFPVLREVLLEKAPESFPIEPGCLIPEMQERPKLKAGIGDGQFDSMIPSLLPGIVKAGVVVHIEHAPDFVIAQELIPSAARLPLGVLLHREGPLHQSLRVLPESFDHNLDKGIAELRPQSL